MYYVCGILLIVTSTFSMEKICELKPTINMGDVRYVCDLIWTQSSIYDLMISVLCVAQCTQGGWLDTLDIDILFTIHIDIL